MAATVAIVGRPNVGKSTLFNRLVRRRQALVHDNAGTTRDWREGMAELGGLRFRVLDTAGLDEAEAGSLEARMRQQTEAALEVCDLALFLIDARVGVTPTDRHFGRWLRKRDRPVLLLANKCEGKAAELRLAESLELGFGEALAVSAAQGDGLDLLYDALAEVLPEGEPRADLAATARPLRLAIVGRPNVGKSTLVNRLLGRERMLTGPEPGITRDAVATLWDWQGQPIELWDTAGLRRRARVEKSLERLAAEDTLRALRFAEVAVLLLDATAPLEHQELTIAQHAIEQGRVLIVAANKWDQVADGKRTLVALGERIGISLAQVKGLQLIPLSARTGRGLERLMPAVMAVHARWDRRIGTGDLNRWLGHATERHPPPLGNRGRRIRIRYMTQVKARPPTFVLFASQADALPESYLRYLRNGLAEAFDLAGVPLRLLLRQPANPYAPSKR